MFKTNKVCLLPICVGHPSFGVHQISSWNPLAVQNEALAFFWLDLGKLHKFMGLVYENLPSQSLTWFTRKWGAWFVGFHVSRFGVLWDFFLRRMKEAAHKLSTNQVLLFVCSSHGQTWEPYFDGSLGRPSERICPQQAGKISQGNIPKSCQTATLRLHPAVSKSCRKVSGDHYVWCDWKFEKSPGPKCIQMDVSENTGFSPQIIPF